MNAFMLAIVTLPLLPGGMPASGGMSLQLRSAKVEQLVAEPYDLRLALANHGSEAISVARAFYMYERILLTTEDGQVECQIADRGLRGAPKLEWETIKPQEELKLSLPAFSCLCQGGESAGCRDWLQKPGKYTLKVVLSHHPVETGEVSSASKSGGLPLDGTLESNPVNVRVLEPTGVDADALTWAQSINEHPFSVKVINKFPSSKYAALVVYGKVNLEGTDPVTVKKLLNRGVFPSWNSVPDPASPDGWSSLHGSEFARWQVEQAERILRDRPDFPYAGQLKLVIGVDNLALGKKANGMTVLRDLARRPDKPEGAWAKDFLALLD